MAIAFKKCGDIKTDIGSLFFLVEDLLYLLHVQYTVINNYQILQRKIMYLINKKSK